MAKKVRLGVIGVGNQGSFYSSVLSGKSVDGKERKEAFEFDNLELGAVCDIRPERVAELKEIFGDEIPVYTDYIEMMESGNVDAVVTTLPHYFHPEVAMAALERDLHVLVEKPVGVYTKQAQRLIDFAATKPELTFGVFFNQRMNPLYVKLKEIIENGEIGELRRTNWIITNWYRTQQYYNSSEWRATWGQEGGGVLVNQAPHQIDLIQWLCGMPKKVYANCKYGYKRDIPTENEVTAMFDYGNGATGIFITCTHDPLGTDRLEIMGNKGKIIVDNSKTATVMRLSMTEEELNESMFTDPDIWQSVKKREDKYMSTEVIEFDSAWGNQHVEVLRRFSDKIVDGVPLVAPGADGINGVRLANAIHLSSWLGREVETDFDEEVYLAELNKRIKEENPDAALKD